MTHGNVKGKNAKVPCITISNYWIPAFAGMTKAGVFDFLRVHHNLAAI